MIIFYEMKGCGFCKKARQELASEIASGLVVVKGTGEAPAGVRGFPHFVNTANGKSSSGYAPKAKLFQALGVSSEEYEGCACRVRQAGGYVTLSQTWV